MAATSLARRVLGTTAVSRALGVSPGQVRRLVDSGQLAGYRRPTKRADVVVRQDDLLAFCRLHKIPADELDVRLEVRVLAVGVSPAWAAGLALQLGAGWEVATAPDLLRAGIALQRSGPDAAVFDAALGRGETVAALAAIAAIVGQRLVLMNEDDDSRAYPAGCPLFRKPADHAAVADWLRGCFEPRCA